MGLLKGENRSERYGKRKRGRGSCCSGGEEVCLHPCRIRQRAFEQTDSRRTPLSAINQQHTHTHNPSLFSPFSPSTLPASLLLLLGEECVRWWLCATENMIYCLQTLKVQPGTTLKEEVVFVCLVCCFLSLYLPFIFLFYFLYNSLLLNSPRWQFKSTTDISAKIPEFWVQRYSENTTGVKAKTTETCCCPLANTKLRSQ